MQIQCHEKIQNSLPGVIKKIEIQVLQTAIHRQQNTSNKNTYNKLFQNASGRAVFGRNNCHQGASVAGNFDIKLGYLYYITIS